MIVSRRAALGSMATAAGAGSAATLLASGPDAQVVPATGRERLLASALGIRGDNTTADTDRAQRAIEEASRAFRTIHFEGQHEWVFRTSLTLFGSEDRGSTMLQGEGAYATVIRLSDPGKAVFVNDTAEKDFRRLSLRGLTVRGGLRGLSISRRGDQVASLFDLNDVRFEFQKDIALHCDQYLISSSFTDVVFYYCNRGVYCGRNANNILFTKARFEGLNGRAVEFASPGGSINGCEDVRFVSPRFEGRNQEPAEDAFVLGGYRLSTLTLDGGYFEETHATILRERGGLGQVVFRNSHFSGQASTGGKLQREVFDSDHLVTLDGNRFITGSDGAPHMLVAGVNRGLSRARYGAFGEFGGTMRYTGPVVPVGSDAVPLLRLSWAGAPPDDPQQAAMTAEIKISLLDADPAGRSGSLRCDLVVTSNSEGTLQVKISSLRPAGAGYRIAAGNVDGDVAIMLMPELPGTAERKAVAEIQGTILFPGDPPFMFS